MQGVRLLVVTVIWLGSFFLAFDRVNISLAAPGIMGELGFTGMQMGLILSVYYWGYLLGNFAGGLVSDRVHLRGLTTLLMLSWCALTALTGLCHSLWQFGVVRLVFGLAEGATANLLHKLQNNWLLPRERGRGYGIFIGFVYLGIALGMPLVGWLIKAWDWRVMFYVSALLTSGLVAVFWLVIRDRPTQHPWLAVPQQRAFAAAISAAHLALDAPLPTRARVMSLLSIPAFLCLSLAAFFVIAVYFTTMSWLPGYLVKERGYTVLNSGIYLTLPYLAAFAGMWSAGSIGDRFGHRALVTLVMAVATCPAIIAVAYSHGVNTTVALMSLMLFLNSAALNGIMVLLFDLIPAAAFGTSAGIVGGLCGGLGGVIGPLLLGYLYDLTGSFQAGFLALALGTVLGAIAMVPVVGYEKKIRAAKAALADAPLTPHAVATSKPRLR